MISFSVALFQLVACFGFGALVLRLLGIAGGVPAREVLVYAFALGMGIIGWLVFFIGVSGNLNDFTLSFVLGVGVILAISLRSGFSLNPERPGGVVSTLLLLLLATVGLMDLLEALTPSGDADTLAYHFALPKLFLNAGRIEFVPRALDGAIAMLTQMTYVPVLGLGGEKGLLLWTFASGWAAVFCVYVLARRHLERNWALALALAFATTPAVIFGAGSGHVEIRNLVFVVAAILAITSNNDQGKLAFPIIAGLLAGFFVGSKYLGLLFAAVCGLAVLWEKRRISAGIVYGLAAVLAGSQWYVWNASHIGDPVFPMLFDWLGTDGTPYWSSEHQWLFRSVFIDSYRAVPNTLFWLLAYPFKATLDGGQAFESARIGFGPLVWLMLPFALAGAWKYRTFIRRGPLLTYVLVTVVFYVLWFFSGSPQKVRFLLPVYPLALIALSVAAIRYASQAFARRPLVAAVAIGIVIQLGGHALYSLKSVQYLLGNETREQFLVRTIADYQPVSWINANLTGTDRLLMRYRNYLYYLDVPYYYAHPQLQAQINLLPNASDPGAFVRQLRALDITHLLLPVSVGSPVSSLRKLSNKAVAAGCLVHVKSFSARSFSSRTLPSLNEKRSNFGLYHLVDKGCVYS